MSHDVEDSKECAGPPTRGRIERLRPILFACFWVLAIGLAFTLDSKVSAAVHHAGVDAWQRQSRSKEILKAPGWFPFTLVIAAMLVVARQARAAATLVIAGVLSGSNELIKWLVGRPRPDVFGQKGLAFPSGHASLAFATAAALAVCFPRWRWAFYAGAALVAMERVAENAHHLSDVVAAAALGVACAQLAKWLLHERNLPVAGDPVL